MITVWGNAVVPCVLADIVIDYEWKPEGVFIRLDRCNSKYFCLIGKGLEAICAGCG